jgi:ribulose-bisphosphate carboxylase large chain
MNAFPDGLDVVYAVRASPQEIDARARDIAIEQTVEVTESLCSDPFVAERVVGRVVGIVESGPDLFDVRISYAADVIGTEIPQLFSVIFGNISLKKGIRVRSVSPSEGLAGRFAGPGFGIAGIRRLLGVADRPLVMGALKPLGRTASELAAYAGAMAMGGMDMIKDDHGLTDQAFAPFEERVRACADAVGEANSRTGQRTLYCPCVTGPADRIVERARFARDVGAGGLLIAPWATGPDFLRLIAREVGLPLIAHPALLGGYMAHPDHGIAPGALLGTMMRLAGADMVVFPGWGGRFPITRDDCAVIDRDLKAPLHAIATAFPVPAGGLTLDRIPEVLDIFGRDVVFLVGSALYEHSPDLASNARHFIDLVDVSLQAASRPDRSDG